VVEVLDAEAALECWGDAPADQRAILLNQPVADPVLRRRLADHGIRNAMVARLYGASSMIGAVIVANRRGSAVFHAQELRALETIASHASAALENARLVKYLQQQALRDPLTGLPNRTVLRDRLAAALARMQKGGEAVAVLFIDLDGFKTVNDQLGHRAGDQLLVAVAQRFRMAVRSSDVVFRFAGDEFIVVCERVEDQEQPLHIAQRVQATLARPFRLDEGEVRVGASIGIAVAHAEEASEALVRRADLAMYEVKKRRKGDHAMSPTGAAAPVAAPDQDGWGQEGQGRTGPRMGPI
jgi:diguanylate cyclase (GGDEF)-like protein